MSAQGIFKRGRAAEWTRERIERLPPQDIKQLRANAERLGESELANLCSELLKTARRTQTAPRKASPPRTRARKLIARTKAFEARGVWLDDVQTSWSGIRKSDGAIVMALWADAVESADGSCSCLLWRPNVAGARPWSDTVAGRERLEHCKRALQLGRAEGLLVYGQALATELPEDKAYTVHGVDPETVILFAVEVRGAEYWAVWGKKAGSMSR
jgi:hypothetical protein